MARFQQGQSGNPKGQKKGWKTKATQKVEEILLAHGYSPVERLIMKSEAAEKLAKEQKKPEDRARFMEIAARNDRTLLEYIAPKRRSVDHSGFVENPGQQTIHHTFEELPRDVRNKLKDSLKTEKK